MDEPKNVTLYLAENPGYLEELGPTLDSFMFTLLDLYLPTGDFEGNPLQQLTMGGPDIVVPLGFRQPDATSSSICVTSPLVFTKNFVFYNCLALAAVAMRYQNGSVELQDDNVNHINESVGMGSLDDFDWHAVLDDMFSCQNAVCGAQNTGNCQGNFTLDEDVEGGIAMTLGNFAREIGHMCPEQADPEKKVEYDDDVAGQGVITAYFIQIALSLLFCTMANIFTYWPGMILSLTSLIQRRRLYSKSSGESKTSIIMGKLRSSRPSAALFSSLGEFQETQAYLILAFQIATLITYQSWQSDQFYNVRASTFYTTIQVLPVLLNQSTLQRNGMRWWYMLGLTLTVYVLGVVEDQMLLRVNEVPLPEFPECRGANWSVPECVWVHNKDIRSHHAQALAREAVVISHVIMILLVLDHVIHLMPQKMYLRLSEAFSKPLNKLQSATGQNLLSVILSLRWMVIDVMVFAMLMVYLNTIDLRLQWYFELSSSWSYGSVVALVPWAPVVAKFLYMILFGITDGVGKRIDPQYNVIRAPTAPEKLRSLSEPAIPSSSSQGTPVISPNTI